MERTPSTVFGAAAVAVLLWVAAQAWIAEDAFITYRTLDNLVDGYGLRWNADERVQTFTHPLWALLHLPLYAVMASWPLASFALGTVCTLGALLATRSLGATDAKRFALLIALPFAVCPAFRVYALSGLENPLTHWMIAAAAALLLKERSSSSCSPPWKWLGLVTGVAALNRLDSLLLFAPVWILLLLRHRERSGWAALGWMALPLLAWELFSLFYYGFPFPNTKYAKMNAGVPLLDLIVHGLFHLRELFYREPQTLLLGGTGLAFALLSPTCVPDGDRDWRARSLAVGGLLYLAYVLAIGGGYMQGRFFAAPLWLGLVLFVHRLRGVSTPSWIGFSVTAAAFAGVSAFVMSFSPGYTTYYGVIDERSVFSRTNSLWTQGRWGEPGRRFADHLFSQRGLRLRAAAEASEDSASPVVVIGAAGLFGYHAGHAVIGLDVYALCDPLLARLPMEPGFLARGTWRGGHFRRALPQGYEQARASGDTSGMHPDLARYYERLRFITRGPLWDPARWAEIVRFNLGVYEPLRQSFLNSQRRSSSVGALYPHRARLDFAARRPGYSISGRPSCRWP